MLLALAGCSDDEEGGPDSDSGSLEATQPG